MGVALKAFIEKTLPNGKTYTESDSSLNSFDVLKASFENSTPSVPIYFILSPGVDATADVSKLAECHKMEQGINFHNISLGQGQDRIAMERLELGHLQGHWVVLNNIHLMPRWLGTLEKRLDEFALAGSHENFRVFFSSDPSSGIPVGILERSIKLTNEPPAGVKANLKRAFSEFSAEDIAEMDGKSKSILFALCHFHALMLERKVCHYLIRSM